MTVSHEKPVKVTVSDPETGEVLESRVIANDYVLITAGNRYVKSIQQMGRTHMIAVAVAKPKGIWLAEEGIKSIREPNKAMLAAACAVPAKVPRRKGESIEAAMCRAIWEAMVDAILTGDA